MSEETRLLGLFAHQPRAVLRACVGFTLSVSHHLSHRQRNTLCRDAALLGRVSDVVLARLVPALCNSKTPEAVGYLLSEVLADLIAMTKEE